MAERKIDIRTLVNRVDPGHRTRKEVDYIFGGRIVKKSIPTQPGKPYKWV